MENVVAYNKSMPYRFLVLFLCFCLLFGLFLKPITAKASLAGTVIIGAYGVTKVILGSKLTVALVAGGFMGFLLEPLLNEVDDWYASDSTIRNWADQYNGVISGGEVITIPQDVQASIRNRYNITDTSINLSTLYVPYDLTHLEIVTAQHLFGVDVSEQLKSNNTLLSKIDTSLNSVGDTLSGLISNVNVNLGKVKNSIESLIVELNKNHLDLSIRLNANLYKLIELQQQFSIWFNGNTNKLEEMRQNIVVKLATTIDKLNQVDQTVQIYTNYLSNKITDSISDLEKKIDILIESLATTANPPSFNNPSQPESDLNDSVSDGKNKFVSLLGDALDLVSRYRIAFLAVGAFVSNVFVSLGFVGDIVVFGLALGLFGALVNLVSEQIKSGSNGSFKKSTKKIKKGG